jgi:two-component system alkaline phosphatase synthesis response regulator PhoP
LAGARGGVVSPDALSRRPRILVVEDEVHLARGIRENLAAEGYAVDVAADGPGGLDRLRAGGFDLVVLDVMLPGLDGFALCRTLRAEGSTVPVLFLTARAGHEDRIRGLELGGDDYLPKPFHLRELLLRVRAILRRTAPADGEGAPAVEFGGNRVDFRSYRGIAWDGREHELTHKEAMILRVLAGRGGEIVTREEILEAVWGCDLFPSTRTIDNFVVRLRKRFEREPETPLHLHTVRGVGYRFTIEPEAPA